MPTTLRAYFCSLLFIPLVVVAQIPDSQIPRTVETYFQRNRLGPELINSQVIDNHASGRTLKIRIIASRNKSAKDLIFAFAAGAAVAHHAAQPIDLLWVDMDINYKDSETTMAIAPTNCTIDAIIFKNCETEKWWDDCMQFP